MSQHCKWWGARLLCMGQFTVNRIESQTQHSFWLHPFSCCDPREVRLVSIAATARCVATAP